MSTPQSALAGDLGFPLGGYSLTNDDDRQDSAHLDLVRAYLAHQPDGGPTDATNALAILRAVNIQSVPPRIVGRLREEQQVDFARLQQLAADLRTPRRGLPPPMGAFATAAENSHPTATASSLPPFLPAAGTGSGGSNEEGTPELNRYRSNPRITALKEVLPPVQAPTEGGFTLPPIVQRIGNQGPSSPSSNPRDSTPPGDAFTLPSRFEAGGGAVSPVVIESDDERGNGSGAEAPEIADSDADSDEEIRVTRAWLQQSQPQPPAEKTGDSSCVFAVGEHVECHYTLSAAVDQECAGVLDFLCFVWSRSVDKREWVPIFRGVRTNGGHRYRVTADDLGHYVRCEAGLDEQRPLHTNPGFVTIDSVTRCELREVLRLPAIGFNARLCPPDKEQLEREREKEKERDKLDPFMAAEKEARRQRQRELTGEDDSTEAKEITPCAVHVVLERKFIKVYRRPDEPEGAPAVAHTKTGWDKDSTVALDATDTSTAKFRLLLPTADLRLSIALPEARDLLALSVRLYQALAQQDICTEVFGPNAGADVQRQWRSSTFALDEVAPIAAAVKDAAIAEPLLRRHEVRKHGLSWFMARETLHAVFYPHSQRAEPVAQSPVAG
eukprot:TRINITY_DN6549_c0_g3_i2.p2 TRINITY_DN6549_c0_g3~~TRINITY_DN6549_c0_g3_i2.p2  ORF type:complete len:611 (-),score=104.29 TRINITY_DN6549_c0_g3_i2:239-2071(-)